MTLHNQGQRWHSMYSFLKDQALIAMEIEDPVQSLGCHVAGVAA